LSVFGHLDLQYNQR